MCIQDSIPCVSMNKLNQTLTWIERLILYYDGPTSDVGLFHYFSLNLSLSFYCYYLALYTFDVNGPGSSQTLSRNLNRNREAGKKIET